MEKKITFSADDKGVATYMERMKRSAEELGRMMIRDARAYSTSGNEVVKVIEEQIRAIEKRNRLDAQLRKSDLEGRYQAGTINETQFKRGVGELKVGTNEDRVQISLLRELIETVKIQSKEELRADRKNVEEQIKSSKTAEMLSPHGDEVKLLKESIQKSELARLKKDEIEEQFWSRADKGKLANGVNVFSGAIGSRNLYEGGASAIGGVPAMLGMGVLGGALFGAVSSLVGRGVREAVGLEKSLSRRSVFSGVKSSAFLSSYEDSMSRDVENYGYTQEQYHNLAIEAARSRGYAYKLDKYGKLRQNTTMDVEAYEMIKASKAYDIDTNLLLSLSKASRGERGSFNTASGRLQALYGGMAKVGAASESDKSLVPEYLQLLIQVNQEQNAMLGKVNTNITGGMILGIANISNEFKRNPEVLKTVIGGFQQGLGRSGIPQVEAMQLNVLSRLSPGGSYYQYREMMESGFQNPKYASKFLESLSKQSGGNTELFADYISQIFFGGKNLRISRQIAESSRSRMGRGQNAFDITGISEDMGVDLTKYGGIGYGTGLLEKATAQTTNRFAQNGAELVQSLKDLYDGVKIMIEDLDKVVQHSEKAARSLESSGKTLDIIKGGIIRQSGGFPVF